MVLYKRSPRRHGKLIPLLFLRPFLGDEAAGSTRVPIKGIEHRVHSFHLGRTRLTPRREQVNILSPSACRSVLAWVDGDLIVHSFPGHWYHAR